MQLSMTHPITSMPAGAEVAAVLLMNSQRGSTSPIAADTDKTAQGEQTHT